MPKEPITPAEQLGIVVKIVESLRLELAGRGERAPSDDRRIEQPLAKEQAILKQPEPGTRREKPAKHASGRPKDPDVSKRRAIVQKYPKYTALQLCSEFDDANVPLPWPLPDPQSHQPWTWAYKDLGFRRKISKLISDDRKKNR
jgi:hypothetical protein